VVQRAIVAIGGGDIRTRGTTPIDREIIRLTKKKHPNLLFIPTASSDSERYWKHVQEYFGGFLKCKTDVLFLIAEQISTKQIGRKIRWADIIYVGGGNTLQMMRAWRRVGVDKLLKSAYDKGTVLSGFPEMDGGGAASKLVMDPAGNLYGAAGTVGAHRQRESRPLRRNDTANDQCHALGTVSSACSDDRERGYEARWNKANGS
jgi:cyanophycinase-like exopeptidase